MANTDTHQAAKLTAQAWFAGMSASIKAQDLHAHMAHVSKKVLVYGMPSKELIKYKEWRSRRRNEFENNEIISLNYQGLRIINATQRRLSFTTTEVLVGKDGKMVWLDKKIILELEDQQWRVVEENINSWRVKKLNLDSIAI